MSFITLNIWSILVAFVVILVLRIMKRRLDYFSSRGLPYLDPPWTTILKAFLPTHLMNYPFEVYDKQKDSDNPIIGYFDLFLKPTLMVVDPSMVQSVFIKEFSHFQDHGFNLDPEFEPMIGNLFHFNGDEWKTLRNKLLPTFTSGKLKGMIPTIEMCAHSVVKDMQLDSSLRQDVNLQDLSRRFAVAVIASSAFGIDPDSVKDPKCEYQRISRKVMAPPVLTMLKFLIVFAFPSVIKYLKFKIFPSDVRDFFVNLTKDTMAMRKTSGVKRNDYIQLLLELKEKGSVQVDHRDLEDDEKHALTRQQELVETESSSKLEMTDELLAAQASVFIIGGFDNIAFLIAITNYILSKNEDVQQKVREEVRAAKSKHGGINYEALKDMKLLDASINEALRLFPPVSFLYRICTKSFTLSNGSVVEKGTHLLVPAKSFHSDSKYWPNPEEFNPDRFLTGDVIPGTYMPFGDGPRICIAKRMSLLMGKIMLTELIDNYQLLPCDKNQEPLRAYAMHSTEVRGGIWGNFKELNQ